MGPQTLITDTDHGPFSCSLIRSSCCLFHFSLLKDPSGFRPGGLVKASLSYPPRQLCDEPRKGYGMSLGFKNDAD